jgi:RimJ/RimL family protein N-acetyltransferase
MAFIEPVTLRGRHAVLEPLSQDHGEGLKAAVADGELWKLWYTSVPSAEEMRANIDMRLKKQAAGTMFSWAVLEPESSDPIGVTSYWSIDPEHRRVEIGGTWYRASAQRTAVNTECKLMLLSRAFEALDCIAVEFRTNFHNRPSRHAIERLGAKLDGVLRSHQRNRDGSLRDTCVYSIVAWEWPAVRSNLEFRLEQAAG